MKNASLRKIIFAALMAALTTVATMIIRIPTPTQGYIHLGDGTHQKLFYNCTYRPRQINACRQTFGAYKLGCKA